MNFLFNTIEVSDLDKSFDFYKEILNLKLSRKIKPEEDVEIVFLEDDKGSTIELIEYQSKKNLNKEKDSKIKMGFSVDDLEETVEFLNERNVEIIEGPIQIKGGRFINIKDPDGVLIGFYEFK